MDRRDLEDIRNNNRELYHSQLKKMRKEGSTPEQESRLLELFNKRDKELLSQGDSLQRLAQGQSINVGNATVSPELSQNNLPDVSKQPLTGKQGMFSNIKKSLGKKVASVLPFAGVAAAALSGDPAMAAEELAQDAMGPAGIAYEALRPETAGNPEEERMMLAERDAMDDYKNSPAAKDAKFAKIRASLNKK